MTDHDKSLFQQAMAEMQDVKPLEPKKQISIDPKLRQQQNNTKPHQVIRKLRQRQQQMDFEQSAAKNLDFDNRPVGNMDCLSYFQPGLRSQEIDKLKKGKFATQAELDLHGLTVEQAEQEIAQFLLQSYGYKLRHLRIIHGKGYNSADNFPVLKNLVNQLLRQNTNIVGFHSAPAKQGGSGAVNILLRAQ